MRFQISNLKWEQTFDVSRMYGKTKAFPVRDGQMVTVLSPYVPEIRCLVWHEIGCIFGELKVIEITN